MTELSDADFSKAIAAAIRFEKGTHCMRNIYFDKEWMVECYSTGNIAVHIHPKPWRPRMDSMHVVVDGRCESCHAIPPALVILTRELYENSI